MCRAAVLDRYIRLPKIPLNIPSPFVCCWMRCETALTCRTTSSAVNLILRGFLFCGKKGISAPLRRFRPNRNKITRYPHWPAQQYLLSVAAEVPEYVVKHVLRIEGHRWYKSQAVRALTFVDANAVEPAIPRVVEWLRHPPVAEAIADQCSDLIANLSNVGCHEAAFTLFLEQTSPVPSTEIAETGTIGWGTEATSRFKKPVGRGAGDHTEYGSPRGN